MTIDISNIHDPDILGELLRDRFFNQNPQGCFFGCVSCFELREGVKKEKEEPVEWVDLNTDPPLIRSDIPDPEDPHVYTVATLDGVKMRYYWEGDGYLEFILPDGRILMNDDCKKDHG